VQKIQNLFNLDLNHHQQCRQKKKSPKIDVGGIRWEG